MHELLTCARLNVHTHIRLPSQHIGKFESPTRHTYICIAVNQSAGKYSTKFHRKIEYCVVCNLAGTRTAISETFAENYVCKGVR